MWMVLQGTGVVRCDNLDEPLRFSHGDTVLLPAAMKNGFVRADEVCSWLEVTIPIASTLSGFDRPEREKQHSLPRDSGFVSINVPRPEVKSSEDAG
jgi:hypothetical protein